METVPALKEEFEECHKNNPDLIVKKEENIVPKVEEHNHICLPNVLFPTHHVASPWMANWLSFHGLQIKLAKYPIIFPKQLQSYSNKSFFTIHTTGDQMIENPTSKMDRDDKFINVKIEQPKSNRKAKQANFCKNYIGLLCSGFARTVLTANFGSEILNFINLTLDQKKLYYGSLKNQENEKLIDSFRNHVNKLMGGKKVRKGTKERDFKIQNTRDLQKLWKILDKDSELTRLKKETLREVVDYFFGSKYYDDWLNNGMMTLENRNFFINNKDEIHKKVLYPGVYKPKFNRNMG